ncbi:MAG: orotidine-5'-phosphate decarboxylase [Solirubrobacteraceae bacterium]
MREGRQVATFFGDRVAGAVTARSSQLVLGLDPDPGRLWPAAIEPLNVTTNTTTTATGSESAARCAAQGVAAHCRLVIEATAEHCVAVKLQLACFERLGVPGWAALSEAAAVAREHGLLVIADGKRGDIGISAAAYAQAFFGETPTPAGPVPGLGVDALTVNPLLGLDSLQPLVEGARAAGGGLFVLVRTSNPGAADVQDLELAGGQLVSEKLAGMVSELGRAGLGSAGLSDVGAVVGATAPERVASLRELMPQAIFLLPGVGAQGGTVEALTGAFAPGPAGGLIAASREIVDAHERVGGDPAEAARLQAERLREAAWSLAPV